MDVLFAPSADRARFGEASPAPESTAVYVVDAVSLLAASIYAFGLLKSPSLPHTVI